MKWGEYVTYKEYLSSPHWKNVRKMRLMLDNNKCCVCGRPFDLEVHHFHYYNFSNERMEDLITLCRHHHELVTNYCNYQKHEATDKRYPNKDMQLAFLFCLKMKDKDKAIIGGNGLNLTDLNVIKEESKKLFFQATDQHFQWSDIQGFFRDLRKEKIITLKKQGADNDWIIGHYGFSYQMTSKYQPGDNDYYNDFYLYLKQMEEI